MLYEVITVLADADHSNAWTQLTLQKAGATLVDGADPCQLPKARKNASELAGMVEAHRKDAVAMCRFLAWLDVITAYSIHYTKLYDLRHLGGQGELGVVGKAQQLGQLVAQGQDFLHQRGVVPLPGIA